jgi:dCTP deaminase
MEAKMTIMRDIEIISSVMQGEIIIDPFVTEHIQAASYDLCLGEQAYVSGKDRVINIQEQSSLELKPGQFAVVITSEKIRLPSDVSADIGISSYWTRKGILLLHGPQIDPGYEGRLVFGLYNASTRPSEISYKHRFCTIIFHRLLGPVQKPYQASPEQLRGLIPADDIRYIRELVDTKTLHELDNELMAFAHDLKLMDNQISELKRTLPQLKDDLIKTMAEGQEQLHKQVSTLQSWVQWGGGTMLGIFTLFAGFVITILYDVAQKIP